MILKRANTIRGTLGWNPRGALFYVSFSKKKISVTAYRIKNDTRTDDDDTIESYRSSRNKYYKNKLSPSLQLIIEIDSGSLGQEGSKKNGISVGESTKIAWLSSDWHEACTNYHQEKEKQSSENDWRTARRTSRQQLRDTLQSKNVQIKRWKRTEEKTLGVSWNTR